MNSTRRILSVLTMVGIGTSGIVWAASHSDAPLIKQDPQANITDVYAFVGQKYDDASQKVLNVVVQVRPFSEPGDGPHYDRFADDARYSIHITDPATAAPVMRYDFLFSAVDGGFKNPNTILSYGLGTEAGPIETIGDARQNYTQTYSVERSMVDVRDDGNDDSDSSDGSDNDSDDDSDDDGGDSDDSDDDDGQRGSRVLASGLVVAPPNAGINVTPSYNDADGRAVSGAVDFASLDTYTQQAIHDLPTGEVVFAGSRDDGFYSDIPGVFDLLNVRILDNNGSLADGLGQDGGGVDGFKGFNVLSFAIQIPIDSLPTGAFENVFFGEQTGVGVYASVSRRKIRIIRNDGRRIGAGPWVQVNRMGNPLFNEGFVALGDKDRYNRTSPVDDQQYATYAENPELAFLINFLYDQGIAENDRADLVNIFIPDVLRVVTTTDPVTLAGQAEFRRLGFLQGDTTNGVSSGFPNGRRLGDDVVDIALTALASGPSFSTITLVGDNVPSNDTEFLQVFPYSGTPHSGVNNRKDTE